MSVKVFTLGLSKIEIGDCGASGAMGTTLTQLGYTNQDSCTLTMDAPETTKFYAEEKSDPVLVSTKSGDVTLEFDLMNPSPSTMAELMGGTASKSATGISDDDVYDTGDDCDTIEKSVKITPEQGYVVEIPRAAITANITGGFKKGELLLLHVTAIALKPDNDTVHKMKLTKKSV